MSDVWFLQPNTAVSLRPFWRQKAVSPAYNLLGTNRYFYLAIGRAKVRGSAKVALVWPIQKLDGPNWYHLQLFWLFLSKLYNFHERISSSYQERKLLFLSPIKNRAYYPLLGPNRYLDIWTLEWRMDCLNLVIYRWLLNTTGVFFLT